MRNTFRLSLFLCVLPFCCSFDTSALAHYELNELEDTVAAPSIERIRSAQPTRRNFFEAPSNIAPSTTNPLVPSFDRPQATINATMSPSPEVTSSPSRGLPNDSFQKVQRLPSESSRAVTNATKQNPQKKENETYAEDLRDWLSEKYKNAVKRTGYTGETIDRAIKGGGVDDGFKEIMTGE